VLVRLRGLGAVPGADLATAGARGARRRGDRGAGPPSGAQPGPECRHGPTRGARHASPTRPSWLGRVGALTLPRRSIQDRSEPPRAGLRGCRVQQARRPTATQGEQTLYLKSLTLKGFKSFASSTTLQLEPGITCI